MCYVRVHLKFSGPRLGLLRAGALSGDHSVARAVRNRDWTDKVEVHMGTINGDCSLAGSLLSAISGDEGVGADGHFPRLSIISQTPGVGVTKKFHQIFAGAVVAVSISSSYYASVFLRAPCFSLTTTGGFVASYNLRRGDYKHLNERAVILQPETSFWT